LIIKKGSSKRKRQRKIGEWQLCDVKVLKVTIRENTLKYVQRMTKLSLKKIKTQVQKRKRKKRIKEKIIPPTPSSFVVTGVCVCVCVCVFGS
jgi:hypothetical protein